MHGSGEMVSGHRQHPSDKNDFMWEAGVKVRMASWLKDKTRGIEKQLETLRQGHLKCSVLAPTARAMEWMRRRNLEQALRRQQESFPDLPPQNP